MTDFRGAIMNAVLEADRMHKEFNTKDRVDKGEGRVDVFDMLVQRDIPLMFKPLNQLLGAFLDEEGSTGVLVTTQRQLPVQRFTAAHELGHAMLGHKPSLDPEDILARSPFVDKEQGNYDLQEIQANIFASELLIPRWLLVNHMMRQKWTATELASPDVIYQLSLRLGVSYSATCHALRHHKVVGTSECDQLLAEKRKTIKERLATPYQPANWYGDVWVITEKDDGILLEGSRTDLVVVKVEEHSGSGYLWRLDDLAAAGLAVVHDSRATDEEDKSIGSFVFRTVIAEAQNGAAGKVCLQEVRPWQTNGVPLHSLHLNVDLSGPVHAGLHKTQLRMALQGAA